MNSNSSKGFGDLFFDFHIHSKYSYDSLSSPKKIYKMALKKGLDGIAITDHNTIRGGLEASKLDGSLYVVIGSEIKTEKGDIIGLFLNDEIKSRDFSGVVEEIKGQDGLIVLPHPFKKDGRVSRDLLDKVDLIETFNGKLSPKQNVKAQELAEKENKPVIGGSDAHLAGSIGTVKTVLNFSDPIKDFEEIKKLLLTGDSSVLGEESPRYVHYFSAAVGNIRKKQFLNLGRLFLKESHRILKK